MNVIFVEPAFPANQREFVRGLAEAGANVIGIGERPADWLDADLRGWMLHYEQIPNVTDVGALIEAVRFAQSKVWIDALESTIESHTMAAAHAREACGIPGTSVHTAYPLPRQAGDEGGPASGRDPNRAVDRRFELRRGA